MLYLTSVAVFSYLIKSIKTILFMISFLQINLSEGSVIRIQPAAVQYV